MAYSSIPSGWLDIGQPVKKELVDLIDTNLEDLNDRVTNVEGSISTAIIANQLIEKERDNAPLGTMVWSPLDESQFQAAADDGGWELCDGATVTGSDYAVLMSRTVIPDLRGKFVRMRAHGTTTTYNPDGDVATDTVQAQATLAHSHVMTHGHANTLDVSSVAFASTSHTHNIAHVHQSLFFDDDALGAGTSTLSGLGGAAPADVTISSSTSKTGIYNLVDGGVLASSGAYAGVTAVRTVDTTFYTGGVTSGPGSSAGSTAVSGTPSTTDSPVITGAVTNFTGSTSSSSGAETRPHNVTENCYIKINKNYITVRTGYLLWRAPQALTINQVVLTPVTQGASGTLTVDVKKGPLTSISTSIFSSLPTLLFSATTAQTGTINPTNAVLAAGDYVRVDIATTQTKLAKFHILIAATP